MTRLLLSIPSLGPAFRLSATPSGPNWIHEIKHDGYRLMTRREAAGLQLLTPTGHKWVSRFPLIIQAIDALRLRSCLIHGEAVCCDADGLPVHRKLRLRRDDRHVFLYAFDVIELDGKDMHREAIQQRKPALGKLLRISPSRGTSYSGTPPASALRASSASVSARNT